MSNKGRWTEPTDRSARDEYRALRRELKLSRTSKARQAEIETRLDEISPIGSKEPSSQIREPKPGIADNLALVARVEAARKTVPVFVPTVDDRKKSIEHAKNATAQEKAEVILADLPEHPLNKLAHELELYLWNEDRSNPKPPVERMSAQRVKHWLSDALYNRHDVRGSRATVDSAVANALKLVADLDAADPDWFVRRAEKLLDAPPTVAKPAVPSQAIQAEDPVETTPIPANTEPALNPVVRASMDLAARALLVLRTDSWLSRLAEHSPEVRTKILAALSDELLRTGFVSGDFCARLYNSSRPKNVSAFPERKL